MCILHITFFILKNLEINKNIHIFAYISVCVKLKPNKR